MKAQDIINKNGNDLSAYTDNEREIVKAYGREVYGLGFADTVKIETVNFNRESYLDAMYL